MASKLKSSLKKDSGDANGSNTALNTSHSSLPSSYPKKQFEYLDLVIKSHPLSLKQRCFLVIINHLFNQYMPSSSSSTSSTSLSTSSSSSSLSNSTSQLAVESLSNLPLELKEELVHFMLEYRLFYGTKISHSDAFIQNILDTRLRSIDFSVIRSKINQNDPTKDLLRACHSLQRLNFSYCYEINDNILKTIISSLNSSSSSLSPSSSTSSMSPSPSTVNISDEGSMDNFSSAVSPKSRSLQAGIANSSNTSSGNLKPLQSQLQKLKNKILKRRKETPRGGSAGSSNGMAMEEERQKHPTKQKHKTNNGNGPTHSTSTDKITSDTGSNISDELSGSASSLTLSELQSSSLISGLEYLSLRQCTSFSSDHTLRKLLSRSPSLTYLDISGCSKITFKTIQVITQSCTRLRTLSISNLRDVLTPAVASTFNNLQSLTSLDISQLPNITSELLDTILTPSNNQSSSSFAHQLSPRSAGISPAASPRKVPTSSPFSSNSTLQQQQLLLYHYQQQLQHYQQQQQQTSTSTSALHSPRSLDDQSISLHYPAMIQSLNLAQSEIEDESLSIIGERCPTLHSLDVSFCIKIGDQGFQDLATLGLNTLTQLSTRLVKAGAGLTELCLLNSMLQKLDIRHTQVDETNLLAIANKLKHLYYLRVDGTHITNDIVSTFLDNNHATLETLGLSQCKNINADIFPILARSSTSTPTTLRHLFISHCRFPGASQTPPAVLAGKVGIFFNATTSLRTLDFCFTPLINDSVLTELSKSRCASTIDSLFIGGGFHNVQAETFTAIVKSCPRMRIFSCLSSFHLKDITILEALKKWTLLEVIELTDCTSLTTSIISFVQQNDNHIHLHLRFLFFGSAMQKEEVDEFAIMCKLEGKTTIELLETQQQVTLEDLIEQGWVNVI